MLPKILSRIKINWEKRNLEGQKEVEELRLELPVKQLKVIEKCCRVSENVAQIRTQVLCRGTAEDVAAGAIPQRK